MPPSRLETLRGNTVKVDNLLLQLLQVIHLALDDPGGDDVLQQRRGESLRRGDVISGVKSETERNVRQPNPQELLVLHRSHANHRGGNQACPCLDSRAYQH